MRHRPWGETNDASGEILYRLNLREKFKLKYKLHVQSE